MSSIKEIKAKHTNIVKYINNTFTLSYDKIDDEIYNCIITNTDNNKSLHYTFSSCNLEPSILSVFVDILEDLSIAIDDDEDVELLSHFKYLIDCNDNKIIQKYYSDYDDYLYLVRKGEVLYEE
jgi:hypothetical protein